MNNKNINITSRSFWVQRLIAIFDKILGTIFLAIVLFIKRNYFAIRFYWIILILLIAAFIWLTVFLVKRPRVQLHDLLFIYSLFLYLGIICVLFAFDVSKLLWFLTSVMLLFFLALFFIIDKLSKKNKKISKLYKILYITFPILSFVLLIFLLLKINFFNTRFLGNVNKGEIVTQDIKPDIKKELKTDADSKSNITIQNNQIKSQSEQNRRNDKKNENNELVKTKIKKSDEPRKKVDSLNNQMKEKEKLPAEPDSNIKQSPKFRTSPQELSLRDVEVMIEENKFFHSMWNENGKGFENQYNDQTIRGNRIIIDNASGLMWQQSASDTIKFEDAKEEIKKLNDKDFAGFNDWRIPTLEEVMSLIEPEREKNLYINAIFDSTISLTWTADSVKWDNVELLRVWVVDFELGFCNCLPIINYCKVLAVCSIKSSGK